MKPFGNKNIEIPFHLLTKYFLKLYKIRISSILQNLNKDINNGKFDDYRTFIFLLYNGLNKGILSSFRDSYLYKGAILPITEFKEMKNNFEKKNNNISLKVLYYSKTFLSFYKVKKKY